MCYEQADYEAEMAAAADGDYEGQFSAYLDDLIRDKQYYLYALEVIADELNSSKFTKSGLSAVEYLYQEKTRLLAPKEQPKRKMPILGECFSCGKKCADTEIECKECDELPF